MKHFDDLTFYELLEIPVDASVFEIRSAYRHQLDVYDGDALGTYALFSEKERRRILSRLESAFAILLDENRRAAYDRQLLADGRVTQSALAGHREKQPMPIFKAAKSTAKKHLTRKIEGRLTDSRIQSLIQQLNCQDQIAGADLKTMRTALGVTLEEVFELSRISVSILGAIEENRLKDLPPPVFLKGFLKSYARLLRLDPDKLMAGFLK